MRSVAKVLGSGEIFRLPMVLVVDDQPELCHAISLLAGKYYRCVEAWSGDAALQVLNDNDVDVIVSDLRMPGMNGVEFLRRAQVVRPNAARILISGYSESDDIIESINQGHILYFIHKPFDKLTIQATLQQAAQHSRLLKDRARLVDELTHLSRELEQRVEQRTLEVELKNAELARTAEELTRAMIKQASLTSAIEQAADGIMITDSDGKIRYVNPAFTAMTGYASEEGVGQYPRFLKSGRQPLQFYEQLWSTILSGRVWHGELINRRKNGSFYNEEMRIAPVHGADGKIASFIAIKNDVTERRAAEEARAFLAAIVENSEDAILAYTPAGTILTFNRGAEAMFGHAAVDMIGKQLSLLVPPERLTAIGQLDGQVLQGNAFSQQEGLCLHKDGRRICVSVTGFPIRNAAGEVTVIAQILRDITERKRADQALRSSEEKFRQLAENIHEVFWMMPPTADQMLYVSPAYEQVWGRTCESLYQNPMSWVEAIHPDDLEQAHALFARQVQGEAIDSEYRIRTPDGAGKVDSGPGFSHSRPGRAIGSNRRNCGGNYRAETLRAGTDSRPRGRRRRQSGEEPLSGQHEPRNPHPDERRHRHDSIAAGNRPHPGAASNTPTWRRPAGGFCLPSSTTSWTFPRSRRERSPLKI